MEQRVRENKAGLLTTSCWAYPPDLPSEFSHLRARKLGSNFSIPRRLGNRKDAFMQGDLS